MRLPLRTSALVIAIALGLVAAMPPARADMGKPEWSAGDYWVYSVSGVNLGASGSGTLRMDVIGRDTANVAGVDYESHRVRLQLNVSGVTFNGGDAWYRVSDLALVKESYNVTVNIPFFGQVTIITTITFNPPLQIRWPATTDSTWSASSSVTVVTQVLPFGPGSNTDIVATTYTVLAPSTVTVPAGTFETTPLRGSVTGGGYAMAYWSPQAGNSARQQEFDDNNAQVSSQELTAYKYQGGNFLGLPLLVWLLLLLLIVILVIAVAMKRRRQPMAPMPPAPPMYPPR